MDRYLQKHQGTTIILHRSWCRSLVKVGCSTGALHKYSWLITQFCVQLHQSERPQIQQNRMSNAAEMDLLNFRLLGSSMGFTEVLLTAFEGVQAPEERRMCGFRRLCVDQRHARHLVGLLCQCPRQPKIGLHFHFLLLPSGGTIAFCSPHLCRTILGS